ncbi:hypothetical protein LTR84_000062 [Exophiala bonariae]|uniref:R3H domain-containing protein n=1 Tax=Exophiala bonariae TaxID=1690606 RepID=A0AAV9NPH9_9EURO|nr:hypothetical protein LTR84_000062 [Exophiala bonariae]
MYLEDIVWSHRQEEILRLFAADNDEKRHRFAPMKNRQRAFIHSLAEDFGFDGESLDPEPHRHVLLFKTPKFVSAPMKTLAQAVRIKRAQLNIVAPIHSSTVEAKPADEVKYDYNGLLLTNVKFGLTEDEVKPLVKKSAASIDFDIIFLSNDDGVGLLPSRSWETPEQLTTSLTGLQPLIASEMAKHHIASTTTLCQFDLSGVEPRVVHVQGKASSSFANGWSQVAAKRAIPMQAPQVKPVGQRPIYTVLGSRLAEAKKRKQENEDRLRKQALKEEVIDDWENEAEQEEQEEAALGSSAQGL